MAWSTGAQLIIFFCFRFSVVLFDRPGISIRNATHCICLVLVFASSKLFNLIYLLTSKRMVMRTEQPTKCLYHISYRGEVAGVKLV